ncbi:MAG: Sensor histidine kinase YycG, partial [Pseudomonadota bacterium]
MASPEAAIPTSRLQRRLPRWWRRMLLLSRQINLFRWLEIGAALALILMLASSYLTLTGGTNPRQIVPSGKAALMLIGTLIPAMSLLVLFGRRLAIRRAGGTTARLHVNLVFFFSLVAAIPTLLVAIFASFLFQSGVEFWFSDNQRGILENANRLAQGYYDQNQREVAGETVAMASDLRFVLQQQSMASQVFQEQYALQVYSRGLTESAVLRQGANGRWEVVAIADPDGSTRKDRISKEALATLRAGEPV